MKKVLFIISLIFAVLLFMPGEGLNSENTSLGDMEEVIKEKKASDDLQQRIETISKELRGNNFLTPRRNVQATHYTHHVRVVKQAEERILHMMRLKGMEQLRKVSEYRSIDQTINYSALLVRSRYHVYTLRKLLI